MEIFWLVIATAVLLLASPALMPSTVWAASLCTFFTIGNASKSIDVQMALSSSGKAALLRAEIYGQILWLPSVLIHASHLFSRQCKTTQEIVWINVQITIEWPQATLVSHARTDNAAICWTWRFSIRTSSTFFIWSLPSTKKSISNLFPQAISQ